MFRVPSEEIKKLVNGKTVSGWREILDRTSPVNPLSFEDVCTILKAGSSDHDAYIEILRHADSIKRQVYSNKVKIFIPVYLSNQCVNNCLYCAYRFGNADMPRRTLTVDEFRAEVERVAGMGYRVIEIVTSESPEIKSNGNIVDYISAAKSVMANLSENRSGSEIILMSWALSGDEFEGITDSGLDCFYLWQETYDVDLYRKYHPEGTPKADFSWRIGVFDRAVKAGIRRIGLGVLFGLSPWKPEILSVIAHGQYLQHEYGVLIDAIGIPRFKPADGVEMAESPFTVSDDELRLAVAVYRLAFPEAHLFLNTREKLDLIIEMLKCGGSEMNIACAVYPGGYTKPAKERQFRHYSFPTEKTLRILKANGFDPVHHETGTEITLK